MHLLLEYPLPQTHGPYYKELIICVLRLILQTDWKLHKRILNFCLISSYISDVTRKAIEKCLHDQGIDKVFTITIDNVSSNDIAISYLKRKMNNLGTLIQERKFLHLLCITCIFNFIISDWLKEMNESIAHVRGVLRYLRQ